MLFCQPYQTSVPVTNHHKSLLKKFKNETGSVHYMQGMFQKPSPFSLLEDRNVSQNLNSTLPSFTSFSSRNSNNNTV